MIMAQNGWTPRLAVFVAALAFAGCGGGENVTSRSLLNAKRTWQAAKIRDYNLEWRSMGAREGHYLVYVRGGRVRKVYLVQPDGQEVEAKPALPDFFGIDGLFQIIDEERLQTQEDQPFGQAKGSRTILKFTPDAKLGYPRHYRRDVVGSLKGLTIDVIQLDTQPAPDIPPPRA
jgi:hypothetical protein